MKKKLSKNDCPILNSHADNFFDKKNYEPCPSNIKIFWEKKIFWEIFRFLSIKEMIKKYSNRIETQKKKKKKKKKAANNDVIEWVDNSYIKKYTDYDALKEFLDSIETKFNKIAEV